MSTFSINKYINAFANIHNNLSHYWLYSVSSKIAFLSLFLGLGAILLKIRNLPPLVPLWYFLPWGEDRLAPYYLIIIFPLVQFLIHVINVIYTGIYLSEYRVFGQIMFLSSIFTSIISTYSIFKIIFIIT